MRIPVMKGAIERRLLINFRVDPEVAAALVPHQFELQLVNGYAVAGICMIRLGHMRPKGLPFAFGTTSESAAHRIAVRWHDDAGTHHGVYVPARHSNAPLNVALGDRLFPGAIDRAQFTVEETDTHMDLEYRSRDQVCAVGAAVTVSDRFEGSTLFDSLADASEFFRGGPAAFSPRRHSPTCDGIELRTSQWSIEPAVVDQVHSSFYDNRERFPDGSIHLDSAFIMRNVPVEWHSLPRLPTTQRAHEMATTNAS
jgi:Uncharacterized conserved protein (COG2071)